MMEKKQKKQIVIKSLLAMGISVVLLICILMMVPQHEEETIVIKAKPVPVEIMEISPPAELDDVVVMIGRVEPDKVVDVAAEVSGRVASIAGRKDKLSATGVITHGPTSAGVIEKGDYVKKGQPIIYINTDILRAQYNKAKAELEFQIEEYQRVQKLFAKDVASRSELDAIKMQRDMARANCNLCKAQLDRTVITAPMDSRINELNVERGEFVTTGQIVAQFVDLRKAKVVVDISQRDITYLKVGQTERIVAGTIEPKELTGKISFISDLADQRAYTTRVELTVDNTDNLLRSGDFPKVFLVRRKLKEPIIAPLSAIIAIEDGHVAYICENGKAVRKRVKLDYSILMGQDVRVAQGLKKGDKLIIAGQRLVSPGQEVTITNTGKADRLNHLEQRNKNIAAKEKEASLNQ